VKKFAALLDSHDAYLISLAEHNFSYTAVFKNLVDWLSRNFADQREGYKNTWRNKPMLLFSVTPAP
jgi:NAD(P)H-dependent FMN reductase